MRFDELFADLAAQYDAAELAEIEAEVAERTRGERGRVPLADRLRAAAGGEVRLRLRGGDPLDGTLRTAGTDWVHVALATGGDVVVAVAAVVTATGLPAVGRAEPSTVLARLGLRHVLRGIARDRRLVRVVLTDGGDLVGVVESVGSDAFDLVEAGELADLPVARRTGTRRVTTVALAVLAYVQDRAAPF